MPSDGHLHSAAYRDIPRYLAFGASRSFLDWLTCGRGCQCVFAFDMTIVSHAPHVVNGFRKTP